MLTLIFSIPLFLGVKALEENGAEKAHAQKMNLPISGSKSFSGFHFFPQFAGAGVSANPFFKFMQRFLKLFFE